MKTLGKITGYIIAILIGFSVAILVEYLIEVIFSWDTPLSITTLIYFSVGLPTAKGVADLLGLK